MYGRPIEYDLSKKKKYAAGGKAFSPLMQAAGNLTSGFAGAIKSPYNQRVGMANPNFAKNMLDMKFTTALSSIGPWGTLVGGVIDTAKNIGAYAKHKRQFNVATKKADIRDDINSSQQGLGQDYTNMARKGMEVPQYNMGGGIPFQGMQPQGQQLPSQGMQQQPGMVPVELENQEVVVMPQQDGQYSLYGQTSANAPKHEEGGVQTQLPNGALVFPKKYVPDIHSALNAGDTASIDRMKGQMLQESQTAALQGQPYSSGGLPMAQNGLEVGQKDVLDHLQGQELSPEQHGTMMESLRQDSPLTPGLGLPEDVTDEGQPMYRDIDPMLEAAINLQTPSEQRSPELSKKNFGTDYPEAASYMEEQRLRQEAADAPTPFIDPYNPPDLSQYETQEVEKIKEKPRVGQNRGMLSEQQRVLNEMIAGDTSGSAPNTLVEDDVLGGKTRAAMDWAKSRGYQVPSVFSRERTDARWAAKKADVYDQTYWSSSHGARVFKDSGKKFDPNTYLPARQKNNYGVTQGDPIVNTGKDPVSVGIGARPKGERAEAMIGAKPSKAARSWMMSGGLKPNAAGGFSASVGGKQPLLPQVSARTASVDPKARKQKTPDPVRDILGGNLSSLNPINLAQTALDPTGTLGNLGRSVAEGTPEMMRGLEKNVLRPTVSDEALDKQAQFYVQSLGKAGKAAAAGTAGVLGLPYALGKAAYDRTPTFNPQGTKGRTKKYPGGAINENKLFTNEADTRQLQANRGEIDAGLTGDGSTVLYQARGVNAPMMTQAELDKRQANSPGFKIIPEKLIRFKENAWDKPMIADPMGFKQEFPKPVYGGDIQAPEQGQMNVEEMQIARIDGLRDLIGRYRVRGGRNAAPGMRDIIKEELLNLMPANEVEDAMTSIDTGENLGKKGKAPNIPKTYTDDKGVTRTLSQKEIETLQRELQAQGGTFEAQLHKKYRQHQQAIFEARKRAAKGKSSVMPKPTYDPSVAPEFFRFGGEVGGPQPILPMLGKPSAWSISGKSVPMFRGGGQVQGGQVKEKQMQQMLQRIGQKLKAKQELTPQEAKIYQAYMQQQQQKQQQPKQMKHGGQVPKYPHGGEVGDPQQYAGTQLDKLQKRGLQGTPFDNMISSPGGISSYHPAYPQVLGNMMNKPYPGITPDQQMAQAVPFMEGKTGAGMAVPEVGINDPSMIGSALYRPPSNVSVPEVGINDPSMIGSSLYGPPSQVAVPEVGVDDPSMIGSKLYGDAPQVSVPEVDINDPSMIGSSLYGDAPAAPTDQNNPVGPLALDEEVPANAKNLITLEDDQILGQKKKIADDQNKNLFLPDLNEPDTTPPDGVAGLTPEEIANLATMPTSGKDLGNWADRSVILPPPKGYRDFKGSLKPGEALGDAFPPDFKAGTYLDPGGAPGDDPNKPPFVADDYLQPGGGPNSNPYTGDKLTNVSPSGQGSAGEYESPDIKGFSPKDFFGLTTAMDVASLVSNWVQPPPPTIQSPRTHLSRQHLDRTPYQQMKEGIKNQAVSSFRNVREGLGQASDLMRATAAIGGETQRNLTGVDISQEQAAQQVDANNVQTQNQEQQLQDQQTAQNEMTNYQLQDAGQKAKDAAVSNSIQNLKQDGLNAANYNQAQKDIAEQRGLDETFKRNQEDLQVLAAKYAVGKDFQETAKYKQYSTDAMKQYQVDLKQALEDEGFGGEFSQAEYGAKQSALAHATREAEAFEKRYQGKTPQASDYGGENKAYDAEMALYNSMKADSAAGKIQQTEYQTAIDRMDSYTKEVRKRWNVSDKRTEMDERYRKENDYLSDKEYIAAVTQLTERGRTIAAK